MKPQKALVTSKAKKGQKATTTTKTIGPGRTTPGFPTGYQLLTVPAKAVVITCDSTVAVVCPGT